MELIELTRQSIADQIALWGSRPTGERRDD